jgi:hypothetical protein
MVFVEGGDYRVLRRPGDDPAQFRSPVRLPLGNIPDSVVHRYEGKNFTTSTWPDSVGNADMSITGVSTSTLNSEPAAESDGVDDIGKSVGPETLPTQESFAVSLFMESNDFNDNTNWMGATNGSTQFLVRDSDVLDGSNGEIRLRLSDSNSAVLEEETQNRVVGKGPTLIVMNKTSDTNIDIYLNDMTRKASSTTNSTGFDSSAYSPPAEMQFFTVDTPTLTGFKAVTMSFIEFRDEPLSQSERTQLTNTIDAL